MVLEEVCCLGNTILDVLTSTTVPTTDHFYGSELLRLIVLRLDESTLGTVSTDSPAFTLLLRGIGAVHDMEYQDCPQAIFLKQVT